MRVRDVEVEPGDIIGVQGTGPVSRAILWASRRKGEAESELSHVGLITSSGPLGSATVVEATRGMVQERVVGAEYDEGQGLVVLRPLNLTGAEVGLVLHHVRRRVGERYGFGDIVLHALERVTGWRWVRRLVTDQQPICSVLVASAFQRVGYSFGMAANTAQPDDIYDFAVTRPDRYSLPIGRIPLELDHEVPT